MNYVGNVFVVVKTMLTFCCLSDKAYLTNNKKGVVLIAQHCHNLMFISKKEIKSHLLMVKKIEFFAMGFVVRPPYVRNQTD